MTRRRLLAGTGLAFQVIPADVDEASIKVAAQRRASRRT